jgi:hypothetical protein
MGVASMVVWLAITFVYFIVVGFIALICLIIFFPLGIIVGLCWLVATGWLLMWSFRSYDKQRFDRFVPQQQSEGGRYWLTRFDALKKRVPVVMNEINSMVQAAGRLFDNGKPDEAFRLASDAKRVFTDFNNEVEEVVTQERRNGVKFSGLGNVMAWLEKMRKDIDLLETALREEVLKAR